MSAFSERHPSRHSPSPTHQVSLVDAMRDIAASLEQDWGEVLIVEAVRQADNDRDQALSLLIEQREVLEVVLEVRRMLLLASGVQARISVPPICVFLLQKRRSEKASRRALRAAAKEMARAARLEARFAAAAAANAAAAAASATASPESEPFSSSGASAASSVARGRDDSGDAGGSVDAGAMAAAAGGGSIDYARAGGDLDVEEAEAEEGEEAEEEEEEGGAPSDAEAPDAEDEGVAGLIRDIHSHKRRRHGSAEWAEGTEAFPNEDCLTGDDSLEEVSEAIDAWLAVVLAPGGAAQPPPSRYAGAFGPGS